MWTASRAPAAGNSIERACDAVAQNNGTTGGCAWARAAEIKHNTPRTRTRKFAYAIGSDSRQCKRIFYRGHGGSPPCPIGPSNTIGPDGIGGIV